MSTPEDIKNSLEENINPEEKSDTIENDLPLEKLLKLSKSFKTGVDENLNKFKNEKMSMINEMSSMNCTLIPNEKHIEINESKKRSLDKPNKEDSEDLILGENYKTEKENDGMCTPPVENKTSELQSINFDQTSNEKMNYLKKALEVENKCQYWMDKYDELHDKYLLLESKRVHIEKENCNYQMEISRIKMIENENSRLIQAIDKSNRVRKELEIALESCHEVVYKYQTDVEVARHKVEEAIKMVEKTYSEKDKLLTDLKESNEKIEILENELSNVIQEAGKKVSSAVEKVKTMYKDKLREANVEIEFLRTEKQIMLNKNQQISSEYEIINKKFKSINQKCENESDVYSKKETIFAQKVKEYEVTIDNLIADVKILKETNKQLQERKRPENNLEQKEMQINELIKHVDAQKQMIEMWRKEMYNIIKAFKHKINELKHRSSKLYKKNRKLRRIIDNSKPHYSIIKKKLLLNRRRNKKYEKYLIIQSIKIRLLSTKILYCFFF
ncbi:putative leucine-rich repeat-containing protein DDB_G0290503 [Melanaphis sacchari]|uniref:putative leucine-rich repeat-containing protein DDB_G0290503 n=1 Tax=Melanaphis sacchari TaxID=742174 RepID=UPI000DC14EED|nr:putative leucine-rich repeat-containing protein DDB_G0290503 [Melanaphis sacchari]